MWEFGSQAEKLRFENDISLHPSVLSFMTEYKRMLHVSDQKTLNFCANCTHQFVLQSHRVLKRYELLSVQLVGTKPEKATQKKASSIEGNNYIIVA